MIDQDISAELAKRVQQAYNQNHPVSITGSGSKVFLEQGEAASEAIRVDLTPHSGILDYEPAELVLTARAGTPLAEIERVLSAQGQMLPFEPPQFQGQAGRTGTLGGAVAAGLSGPARPWQGAVRDAVLGVRMINGQGQILKFGGQVMKNVAGYDVSRLMVGAFGTLGVLLDISVRVVPMPRAQQTQIVTTTAEQALARFAEWNQTALPITGATFADGQLRVRLGGAESAVHKAVLRIGGDTLTETDATRYWQDLRDHRLDFFQPDDTPVETDLWRAAVPLTTPVAALPSARQLIDWGGQQRWLHLTSDQATEFRTMVPQLTGHATLFRPAKSKPAETERFQPLPPPLLALHQRIKKAMDPKGIFNAGRLFPE